MKAIQFPQNIPNRVSLSANRVTILSSPVVSFVGKTRYYKPFKFNHKHTGQYRTQGRPPNNSIILNINAIIKRKMNNLGTRVKHFSHFMSTYISINFSPVVNSVRYSVTCLVQRNVGEKQIFMKFLVLTLFTNDFDFFTVYSDSLNPFSPTYVETRSTNCIFT